MCRQVRDMQSEQVMYAMLGILVLCGIYTVSGKFIRWVMCFVFKAAAGTAAIAAMDVVLSPIGIAVGLNGFTAAITGLLGVPGFIMLYTLAWLLR